MWVAAERLPQFGTLYPDAHLAPPIEAPAEFAERAWTRDDALVEIVRSRLEGLGPTTTSAIAGFRNLRFRSLSEELFQRFEKENHAAHQSDEGSDEETGASSEDQVESAAAFRRLRWSSGL